MLAPTLMIHGTEEQKTDYLPDIAAGKVQWCQGYSEPNAGSDAGAIAISDVAKTGQLLTFALREPAGAREDLMRMSSDLQRDRPDASFGLYFNCMARGRGLYGEPDVDSRTLRESLKGVPVAGFFTGSEIAPIQGKTHLHQYSGILLLVSDAL